MLHISSVFSLLLILILAAVYPLVFVIMYPVSIAKLQFNARWWWEFIKSQILRSVHFNAQNTTSMNHLYTRIKDLAWPLVSNSHSFHRLYSSWIRLLCSAITSMWWRIFSKDHRTRKHDTKGKQTIVSDWQKVYSKFTSSSSKFKTNNCLVTIWLVPYKPFLRLSI